MSTPAPPSPVSTPAADVQRAWEAVHGDAATQFAPLPPYRQPPPPDWLKALGEWLRSVFEPVGQFFGASWPVFQYVLIGLAVLLVLFLLWRTFAPMLMNRRARPPEQAEAWMPERAQAVALLEDADRLAAEGRFGEAVHLLLQRSVHHIANARSDWLLPASTAREIAQLPHLPRAARQAFAEIAMRVERSLFALRELDAADWQAARGAYADFALQDLRKGAV